MRNRVLSDEELEIKYMMCDVLPFRLALPRCWIISRAVPAFRIPHRSTHDSGQCADVPFLHMFLACMMMICMLKYK